MNSLLLMLISGHIKHMEMFPTPPMPIRDIKGPLLTEPLIIAGVVFILAVILLPRFSVTRNLLRRNRRKVINDYEPTANHDPSFEENLKHLKLKPQKVITFGTNRLAIDNTKKKLFLRSSKVIDGALLDFGDITSYELIKDGIVIGRYGGGSIDTAVSAGEDGIICSDLRLVIATGSSSGGGVVLPFIAFSIDSEFAYKEALGAAKEAAEELDGIIR